MHPEIIVFFFIIAFVYASVGFGGGSSYLAILAVYAFPFKEMRLIALICNIIVVTGGTWVYIRNRQVKWERILPIALVSVPAAFAGASLRISQNTFFIILGCSLITAAILLWVQTRTQELPVTPASKNFLKDGIIGGAIGFLSGMVGIGGGIFLAPVLNLLRWDDAKKIAATASVFILVNSVSGIAGQLIHLPPALHWVRILLLCLAVLAGGQLGSRLGSLKFKQLTIRRVTAILVFFAGVEVLYRHLPWFK